MLMNSLDQVSRLAGSKAAPRSRGRAAGCEAPRPAEASGRASFPWQAFHGTPRGACPGLQQAGLVDVSSLEMESLSDNLVPAFSSCKANPVQSRSKPWEPSPRCVDLSTLRPAGRPCRQPWSRQADAM